MDQGFTNNAANSTPTGAPGGGYPAQPSQPHRSGLHKPTLILVASVVVALAIGFAAGMYYQKGQDDGVDRAVNTTDTGLEGRQGRMGNIGSVAAVSGTSITVSSQRSGESVTYTINADTKVTNNGADAAVADIKVGNTVAIQSSGRGSAVATVITLNPSTGGPGMGGAAGTQEAGSGAAGGAAN